MVYQIDQSGKVEQTERITVVAFSNDKYGSISQSSKIKKDLLAIFRKAGKPKMFSIQTFAALVFLLLKKYKINEKKIIIDQEYPGHENLIKSYILQLAKSTKSIKLNSGSIEFKLIGKSSN